MTIHKSNLSRSLGKIAGNATTDKPKMSVISKNESTGAMNVALYHGGKMYTTQVYEEVGRARTKVFTITSLPDTADL